MKKFLIIFLTISSFQFAQFSSWEYYGDMDRPVAGGDIWHATGGEIFYIFGGYSDSLQANVDWVQKYRVYFDISKIFDKMSTPRYGLVSENYNNFAYFFGGINDESSSITGIEKWSESFTDEAVFNHDINFNRIFSTGHIVGDNYYIIGGNSLQGTSSDTLPYIVEYNLPESSITFSIDSLFNPGELPDQQMSEVVGDEIFIFGGVINGISQDIYKFNIISRLYEKLPITLLEPRAGGRAVLVSDQNKIFIIGGYNEAFEALNSVEIFTVYGNDQYEIEKGPPIQEARYYFMSSYLDGSIYILGGFDGFNDDRYVLKSIEKLGTSITTMINNESSFEVFDQFELYQNYPNPFNPTTIIKYQIPNAETQINSNFQYSTTLTVYDILGNEIVTLVNQQQSPGIYEIEFDASEYPSGVYYYQLKIYAPGRGNSFIQTKKMILLK
jgi:hypothetical protein